MYVVYVLQGTMGDWRGEPGLSCSQRGRVGHHCCCSVNRGDQGKTVAHLDLSIQEVTVEEREK